MQTIIFLSALGGARVTAALVSCELASGCVSGAEFGNTDKHGQARTARTAGTVGYFANIKIGGMVSILLDVADQQS